jgi:RNA polymerase sigma-70 factor (ECF subfamily)
MATVPDRARFEAFLAKHRGILLKVAHMYCRDPEDRRDLVQEISIQVWQAWPNFDEARVFSTWLYRIALNIAISHRRSASTRARHVSPVDAGTLAALPDPAALEPDDRVRELYRVIDQQDDLHRALLLLYLEGREYREIAEVLGLSETNVATKLSRLKQRLRAEMGSDRGQTRVRPLGV